ncbi:MAG: ATPase, AAA family [uncultured Sulfurovum sp.]|uniref:ATPase, AAA family n=1 Tax=uncultured Sulfurovum sp. TaxID=269237 RepID=A0A6S6SBE1_9BACT|nr:MAG: ATPase, AAA family [uncultured Sulfurovum sp.]
MLDLEYNLRFPGQYFDSETSTHYNINRDYNPVTGRYIQSDPIGFDGGVNNGFGYASQAPIKTYDSLGLYTVYWGGAGLNGAYISDQVSALYGAGLRNIQIGNNASTGEITDGLRTSMFRYETSMKLLNNTLKAQGYEEVNKNKSADLPSNYSLEFVNTNTNLDELVEGIKNHHSARVCLYGASGTGKSAFAKHIAKKLDKSYVIKSGSSLMSKWVGETEKNIASAFREAMEEEAVLIFDEVDGFLAERGQAKVNWEVTQVNEMLVQMEKFDGIFIATTNLIEHIDQASLRRFDLKLEFKTLAPEQLEKIFISYAKELNIEAPTANELHTIRSFKKLSPGDFATIIRQSKFKKIDSCEEFIKRLKEEQKLKKNKDGGSMGFIS